MGVLSMMGDPSKRTAPITEANFSGAELAKLRRLIELAKTRPVSDKKTGKVLPNTVTYAHHDAYKDRYERLGGLPGPDTDSSSFSTANLRNTLGTFSFKEMPDGTYVVKDTYDFTGDVNEKDNFFIRRAKQAGVSRPVQIVVPALKERKVQPKSRATGSPSTGETSADLYRSLLKSSDLSRLIPTSPPSGSSKDSKKSQEDLRNLVLAMNPDAQGIEEAVAGVPKTLDATKRAGKGFYEANVAPLLSPIETAKGLVNLAGEFATNPYRTTIDVAGAEGDRLNKTRDSSGNFAEYLGGAVNPFSRVLRAPRTDVIRPKNEGLVLNEPQVGGDWLNKDGTVRSPLGYTAKYLESATEQVKIAGKKNNLPKEQIDAIKEFFDRKAKNYFVKQIGTSDDPLFNAISQGRLTTPGLREPGGIPSYMTEGAQVGKNRVDPETGRTRFYPSPKAAEALRDMTAIYDRMVNMRGTFFANQTLGGPEYETLVRKDFEGRQPVIQERITDKLIQEGVNPNQITEGAVDLVGYKDPKFVKNTPNANNLVGYPRSPTPDIARMLAAKPETLSKTLSTSLGKGDIVYDIQPTRTLSAILQPANIIDYLATLPPEKIKKIRFEDAVVGSAKLTEKADTKRVLFDRITQNKPVPNEVFSEGVSDPVLDFPKESPFAGYTWRRIMTPEAAEIEGAYIGHSVGGYSATNPGMVYDAQKRQNFAEGRTQVYSLRDLRGRPVTTVEVFAPPGARPLVSQVRGAGRATGNTMPMQFDMPVTEFLEFLNPSRVVEQDRFLPPVALSFKRQKENPDPLRASPGRGQPVGNPDAANNFLRRVAEENPALAARAAANPQMLEDALRRQAEALQPPPQVREGIGQLPNAPQNLPNEGRIRATLRRLGID